MASTQTNTSIADKQYATTELLPKPAANAIAPQPPSRHSR